MWAGPVALAALRRYKPMDGHIEAEYADGYVHSERKLKDVSPYEAGRNVLNDIVADRPAEEHGRLVRFSIFINNIRHDELVATWPIGVRPMRYRHLEQDYTPSTGSVSEVRLTNIEFGYEYDGNDGELVKKSALTHHP